MKIFKCFEFKKVNNITEQDIINCINNNGIIFSTIIKGYPNNDKDLPLTPVSIDEYGNITIDLDGNLYEVDLEDVERIEFGKVNEDVKVSIVEQDVKKFFPKELSIITSNGQFNLKLCDVLLNFPKIQVAYHHFTPDITGDVLSDGEPDYLCFDLNFMKKNQHFEINVELTYGDAMMFEFKLSPTNQVEIGHYNGYGSKFDPDYLFSFTEESINDLMKFFNRFTFGLNLTRDRFNFLDSRKDSYKIEKVDYHRIINFSEFKTQN